MEVAKTKIASLFAVVFLLYSCSGSYSYTWQKYTMDGHRSGVIAPNADNTDAALGIIKDSVYAAPNGREFSKGTVTYDVAKDMIGVQADMSHLKEVIGFSAKEMLRYSPECELSNWVVDHIMTDVASLTGKKIDLGIANIGGIRVDMPAGDILKDDIVSMFPFNNYLAYVSLKGSDIQSVFDQMAAGRVQPIGGVKLVINDKKVDTLLIGGKAIDPDKVYGVATIDFLLDGGDSLYLAKNSKQLIITKTKIVDSFLPYVRSYEGKAIDSNLDGRVVIREGGK